MALWKGGKKINTWKTKIHCYSKQRLCCILLFIYLSPPYWLSPEIEKHHIFTLPHLPLLSWFAQNSGLKMKVKESSKKDEDENRWNTTEIITRHTLGENFPPTVSRGRFPSNRFTCKHTQPTRFLSISPFSANCGHPTHYHMCMTISMSSHKKTDLNSIRMYWKNTSFFAYTSGFFALKK